MKELLVYLYDTCVITEISLLAWWVNSEEEYKITTLAESRGEKLSLEGISTSPEKLVSDINIDNMDNIAGIVFPGGKEITPSQETIALIRAIKSQNKLLGAICAGPTFLAMAGVLKDSRYTTTRTPEFFKDQKIPDPFPWENKQDVRVIRDGNVVTSTGAAFMEFADECLGFLGLYSDTDDRKSFINDFIPQWNI